MQFTLSTIAVVASLLSVSSAAPTPNFGGERGNDSNHEVEILACKERGDRFRWDSERLVCVEIGEVNSGSRFGSGHVSRDGGFDSDHHVEILACKERGDRFRWDSERLVCVEISESNTRFGASGRREGNNFRRDANPAPRDDRDRNHEVEILACKERGDRFRWDSERLVCVEIGEVRSGHVSRGDGGFDSDHHVEILACKERGDRFRWDSERLVCVEISESNTRFGASGRREGNNFRRDADAAPRDDRNDRNHEVEIAECVRRGPGFRWNSITLVCEVVAVHDSNSRFGNSRSGRDSRFGGY